MLKIWFVFIMNEYAWLGCGFKYQRALLEQSDKGFFYCIRSKSYEIK